MDSVAELLLPLNFSGFWVLWGPNNKPIVIVGRRNCIAAAAAVIKRAFYTASGEESGVVVVVGGVGFGELGVQESES